MFSVCDFNANHDYVINNKIRERCFESNATTVHVAPRIEQWIDERHKFHSGCKNLLVDSYPFKIASLVGVDFAATTTSIEKAAMASVTDIVPNAEERRPENGKESGDRPHCVLILILPTTVAKESTMDAEDSE